MLKKIHKIIIIIVAVVVSIGLGVGGYLYLNNLKKSEGTPPETSALKDARDTADKITESATKGVLPSIQTNPMENKPDINPASKANPIKDIKTNPFE